MKILLGTATFLLLVIPNPVYQNNILAEIDGCIVSEHRYQPESNMSNATLRVTVSNTCDYPVYVKICILNVKEKWHHNAIKINAHKSNYYEAYNPLGSDTYDVYVDTERRPKVKCG